MNILSCRNSDRQVILSLKIVLFRPFCGEMIVKPARRIPKNAKRSPFTPGRAQSVLVLFFFSRVRGFDCHVSDVATAVALVFVRKALWGRTQEASCIFFSQHVDTSAALTVWADSYSRIPLIGSRLDVSVQI